MKLPILLRDSEQPLRRQLYEQIRIQILRGDMQAGEPLPSTRLLADELGVARSTVVESYDMLLAEGYITSRQGAQTIVSEGLVIDPPPAPQARKQAKQSAQLRADFSTGRPDLVSFPHALWSKTLAQSTANLTAQDYGYTGPQGYAPLRREIAGWLARGRGIRVDADDIFITCGATHALNLLTNLLCGNGGSAMIEDPCHKGLYQALLTCGCNVVPVPADDHGLQAERLTCDVRASMIYVTPSHQFPLGGILPAQRRAALIRYAREHDTYIVEDDYDSEFRYSGAPIAPLCSMDPQRVIYVGTFSKTMFPALRIGYTILPKPLQKRWRELRTYSDVQNPPFEQAALADFLHARRFDRHIHTMRTLYGKRRQALLDSLTVCFGERFAVRGDAAGLHTAVRFPNQIFDDAFSVRCRSLGVHAVPLREHCIAQRGFDDTLVLGYGHLQPEQIETGIRLLADAIGPLK